jgi:hypothetical protein
MIVWDAVAKIAAANLLSETLFAFVLSVITLD